MSVQGSFPRKRSVGAKHGGSRISKWAPAPRGMAVGGMSSSPLVRGLGSRKNVDVVSQIGEFRCKLGAFCAVHLKLV